MERVFITIFLFYLSSSAFSQCINAELVLQETNISFRNGKLYKSINYEIQINNREGEKLTTNSIPYSSLVKISKIEASVKDTNGIVIKKLQKNDITTKSAISEYSLYEDNFIKEFTLKHNSYPYRICYSYEVQEDEYLTLENWIPIIDINTPTRKAILTVEVPKVYKILYSSKYIDNFKIDSTDILIKYTWTSSNIKVIEPEIYSTDVVSYLPHVIIVPKNFTYDLPGSFDSWVQYGEWENELLKNLSDLPQNEKYIISGIIEGINDPREKIKRLYYYLQDHTRYINVTIETGGLKPYPASYVAANKYGDCKALANYFKAILDEVGIKSYCTDVYAGSRIFEINKAFPSQQFNHVILCVPDGRDTIWLDCTSKRAFRYLGTFTQDRDVFIIKGEESKMARTPRLTNKDVKQSRTVLFHQNLQNQTIADFSNTYRGKEYEMYFSLFTSANESEKQRLFAKNIVNRGFELNEFNLIELPRDSAKFSVKYSALSNKVYKEYGNDLIIEVLPFSIPDFESTKKRKLPVQIDYPIYKTDSLVYEIPSDYKLPKKLDNVSVRSEFGNYKIEFTLKEQKVYVVKSFLLFSGKYSLDKYPDFYEYLTKVIDIESNSLIVLNKKI